MSVNVPYFSQWESRDITKTIVAEGARVALLRDPLWTSSGAHTVEEYAEWAGHICGMACLKMVLAARTGQIIPTLELARACTVYGGYEVNSMDNTIVGLKYDPFVRFIREKFGLNAEVLNPVLASNLPYIMTESEYFIASVHEDIRWPNRASPALPGGHLVLVTVASSSAITFHNPSGHDQISQENVTLPIDVFSRFFAGRGIVINPVVRSAE